MTMIVCVICVVGIVIKDTMKIRMWIIIAITLL